MKFFPLYPEGNPRPVIIQLNNISMLHYRDYDSPGTYEIRMNLCGVKQVFTYDTKENRDEIYDLLVSELLQLNDIIV